MEIKCGIVPHSITRGTSAPGVDWFKAGLDVDPIDAYYRFDAMVENNVRP